MICSSNLSVLMKRSYTKFTCDNKIFSLVMTYRRCEICSQATKNIRGVGDNIFMESSETRTMETTGGSRRGVDAGGFSQSAILSWCVWSWLSSFRGIYANIIFEDEHAHHNAFAAADSWFKLCCWIVISLRMLAHLIQRFSFLF